MSIGTRLKSARLHRAWTQRDLAEAAGVSVQAVSQWENDRTVPGIARLNELANVLRLNLDWLMDQSNDQPQVVEPSPLEKVTEGRTPIIAKEEAYHFRLGLIQHPKQMPTVLGYVQPTVQHKKPTFAIEIDRDYPEVLRSGDIAIFETAYAAEVGDIVLVVVMKTGALLDHYYGRVVEECFEGSDDKQVGVRPLDPSFPPIFGDDHPEWLPSVVQGVLRELRRFKPKHGSASW